MLKEGQGMRGSAGPLVVYDGECDLCLQWVGRVRAIDGEGRVRSMPLQDGCAERVTGRTPVQLRRALHLVHPDGTVVQGAEAIRDVLGYLRGGRFVSWLFRLPGAMWLATRIYVRVAGRRQSLAISTGTAGGRDVHSGSTEAR